jgi:hypothetical protein
MQSFAILALAATALAQGGGPKTIDPLAAMSREEQGRESPKSKNVMP